MKKLASAVDGHWRTYNAFASLKINIGQKIEELWLSLNYWKLGKSHC